MKFGKHQFATGRIAKSFRKLTTVPDKELLIRQNGLDSVKVYLRLELTRNEILGVTRKCGVYESHPVGARRRETVEI